MNTLDLTSGFRGQSTSRVGAVLPGPYVRATGAPLVDVDVDVEGDESLDSPLLDFETHPWVELEVAAEFVKQLATQLLLPQEATAPNCYFLYPLCPRRS